MNKELTDLQQRDADEFDRINKELDELKAIGKKEIDEYHAKIESHSKEYRKRLLLICNMQ